MATLTNTRKQKRVSRNKKKNWRKHVNIDDVEDYFEDKRLQERTGGLVAEKSDDALFFIEKNKDPEAADKKSSRLVAKDKPLKCYEKLKSDSSVKIPKIPRSESPKSLKPVRKSNHQKAKCLAASKNTKSGKQSKNLPSVYDVWDDNAENIIFRKRNCIKGGLDLNADKYYLQQTNRISVEIPNTGTVKNKPSALPTVEIPHPGASYNPTYEDHQDLLQKAAVVEMEKDKKEKRLVRALDGHFPAASDAPTSSLELQEMSVGVFAPIDSGDDDDEQIASSSISYNPPVRREDKKSVAQRNKEKRLKEKEKKLKQVKEGKQKNNEIFRIKQLKKDLNLEKAKLLEQAKKTTEKKKKKAFETKKLGKVKFETPDLELKLGEELEGSLRELKPEGNLLLDRFKSLQKRNLIETRERAKYKRKYKPKEFEKKSHSEIKI